MSFKFKNLKIGEHFIPHMEWLAGHKEVSDYVKVRKTSLVNKRVGQAIRMETEEIIDIDINEDVRRLVLQKPVKTKTRKKRR